MYDSIKLVRDISLESCEETWTIHTERTNINGTKRSKALDFRIVYEGLEIPPFLQETFIRMVMNRHIAIKDDRVHYKSSEIINLGELNRNLILLQTESPVLVPVLGVGCEEIIGHWNEVTENFIPIVDTFKKSVKEWMDTSGHKRFVINVSTHILTPSNVYTSYNSIGDIPNKRTIFTNQ